MSMSKSWHLLNQVQGRITPGNRGTWACQLPCFMETQDVYHCHLFFFSLWKAVVLPLCQPLLLEQWRCEFLPMTAALLHQQGVPLHIKGPKWLVQHVVVVTDNYHKDKILQLIFPAVQNNLSCSRLTAISSSQPNTVLVLVLSSCGSAGLQNRRILLQKASCIFRTFC